MPTARSSSNCGSSRATRPRGRGRRAVRYRGRREFLPDSLTPLPMSLSANLRAPVLVLACGATILALGLGIRQSFGLFPQPMSPDLGWGRSNIPFAIALSSLIWGLAQPFFGAWADNKGPGRVVAVSGLLFAGGLALM